MKQQLEQHLGAEEFNNKLQRARSRTDSQSDTASLNGSINQSDSGDRKNSLNRSDSSLRRRSSAKEVVQQPEKTETNVGEKLIEAEKAETGNVNLVIIDKIIIHPLLTTNFPGQMECIFSLLKKYWFGSFTDNDFIELGLPRIQYRFQYVADRLVK